MLRSGHGCRRRHDQLPRVPSHALAHNAHVALAFPFGAELDDPAGLLGGTGARVRNVRLASLDDVARPELRELIAQATHHRMLPVPDEVTLRD